MCEAVGVRFVRVFYKSIVLSEMEWVRLNEFVGRLRALAPDLFFFLSQLAPDRSLNSAWVIDRNIPTY